MADMETGLDKLDEILDNMDPEDYFKNLKDKKQETTDEFLQSLYTNTETLIKKAFALGQKVAVRKLMFTAEVIEKEKKLFDLGFKTFLYRDDIEYYIDKVAKSVIKIIELKNYTRVIPDEVAEQVIKLKEENIFDEYFIVFTDYTNESAREVKKEDIRKDPILFGVFLKDDKNVRGRLLHDRFYYIADWEDEYCDLTLSKLVSEMAEKGKNIERTVSDTVNASVEDIKDYMNKLDKDFKVKSSKEKKSFLQNIKTFLTTELPLLR